VATVAETAVKIVLISQKQTREIPTCGEQSEKVILASKKQTFYQ
jgi:hypothetical protein